MRICYFSRKNWRIGLRLFSRCRKSPTEYDGISVSRKAIKVTDEQIVILAFRAMDDEHKQQMVLAMSAVAKDYPARARARASLRLVGSDSLKSDRLGQ